MSEHSAIVEWQRTTPEFAYATYNRAHRVRFAHGLEYLAGAAPENIPATAPRAPGIDPEQAFVASLSSCHMLWFLHLAVTRKLVVDRYIDHAVGVLGKDAEGRTAMTRVTLRPSVVFGGPVPSANELRELHEKAHERCFIANSVRTEIVIEPQA